MTLNYSLKAELLLLVTSSSVNLLYHVSTLLGNGKEGKIENRWEDISLAHSSAPEIQWVCFVCVPVSKWQSNSNREVFLKRLFSKYLMWEDTCKLIRWSKRIVLFIQGKIKHIFLPSQWYMKRKQNIVCNCLFGQRSRGPWGQDKGCLSHPTQGNNPA